MGTILDSYELTRKVNYLERAYRDICCKAKSCLGIKSTGNINKFLNERGQWVTITEDIIEVTKAELLALIASNSVQNVSYSITDISGFESVIVTGVSPNEIRPSGDGLLFIPDYTITGDNLGQMEWDNIPAIQPNEFVVWGGFYWKNETVSPITPTITDDTTLAGGLTKLTKSIANGYIKHPVDVLLDTSLNVISVSDGFGNKVNVPQSSTTSLIALGLTYENFQWNYNTKWINNEAYIVNCYGTGAVFSNKNDSNAGYISQCSIGANCFLFQNNFTASVPSFQPAYIKNVKLISNAYMYGNELHLSYFETIELTDWSIGENHLTNLSFIKNCILDANGSFGFIASSVFNSKSGFDGFTYTDKADINNSYLNNKTVIENASDIQIQNFQSDKSLDLTGFTSDILSQTISAGKGFFTLNYDFGSDPITSGNAVIVNLIPNTAVCDKATLIVNSALSGTGNLEIGVQTDDADYVIASTAVGSVANTVVNTLSNAASANRSLRLAVSGGDITGGTITVKLEFVV